MLVLGRKVYQRIVLPTLGISIQIVRVRKHSGEVRVAIDAPADVPVHREEVWKAILAQAVADDLRRRAEGPPCP